jgi:hypothetical protein
VLLIAHVHKPDEPTEAEPVTVVAWSNTAAFVLDDGTEIVFDVAELRVALDADVLAEEAA